MVFGIGNFFFAMISDVGFLATSFMGIGGILSIFVERTVLCCLRLRRKQEKPPSVFVEKGKVKFKNICILITNISF